MKLGAEPARLGGRPASRGEEPERWGLLGLLSPERLSSGTGACRLTTSEAHLSSHGGEDDDFADSADRNPLRGERGLLFHFSRGLFPYVPGYMVLPPRPG